MRNQYIDAHLHLQDHCFDGITGDVIAQAESAGVTRFFSNAVTESDWSYLVELSSLNPAVFPFIGIHPWFCHTLKPGWQTRLADLITTLPDASAGIGETGLDKIKPVDFEIQRKVLIDHLELAADFNLPVSIHCVKAWGPLLKILERFCSRHTLPPLMIHSYNGSTETMKRLVDYGCMISYSTPMAYADKQKLQDTVKQTPISALMLETDSPFQKNLNLNDVSYVTTDHNEPVAVSALYRYTAKLLNMDLSDFSSQLWKNAAIFTNQTADR